MARPSYTAFTFALLLFYLAIPAGQPLDSMPRYALAFFPPFIVLAYYSRQRGVTWALVAGFAALLAYFTMLFARWYWVS